MKSEKVRVTAIENGKALRNGIVEGEALLPEVGKCFCVTAPPLEPGYDLRIFKTSRVQEVDMEEGNDNVFLIKTENSLYRVEVVAND